MVDQETFEVETELGRLQFTIQTAIEGNARFVGNVVVNRIPYKVDGRFRISDKYGHDENRNWGPTGEKVVYLGGYLPICRLDKDYHDREPTSNARKKIEEVITKAVVPVFAEATESGATGRILTRSRIRQLEYQIKAEQADIERSKQSIEKYRQEINELEEEIFQSLA